MLTTAGRTVGYALGSLLTFLGIMGLGIEVVEGRTSSNICAGYVMGVAFLAWGLFLLFAVRKNYGGGICSFIGTALLALLTIGLGHAADDLIRGERLFLRGGGLPLFGAWALGIYLVVWGHMRHRRKRANQGKSIEPHEPGQKNDNPMPPIGA